MPSIFKVYSTAAIHSSVLLLKTVAVILSPQLYTALVINTYNGYEDLNG